MAPTAVHARANGFFSGAELREDRARGREEPVAGRRRNHLASEPMEQAGAQPVLDVEELMAEGRLREVQHGTRARKTAAFGDRGDESKVAELEIHRVLYPRGDPTSYALHASTAIHAFLSCRPCAGQMGWDERLSPGSTGRAPCRFPGVRRVRRGPRPPIRAAGPWSPRRCRCKGGVTPARS